MLPLLTKKAHYSTVPHGYARGYEPVTYVRRIREYDEVLTSRVPEPEKPPFRIGPAEEDEAGRHVHASAVGVDVISSAGTP